MEMPEDDADELVEFWTLLDGDRGLLAGKRGATALGCALLLKYYSRHGRFPRGGADLPERATERTDCMARAPVQERRPVTPRHLS